MESRRIGLYVLGRARHLQLSDVQEIAPPEMWRNNRETKQDTRCEDDDLDKNKGWRLGLSRRIFMIPEMLMSGPDQSCFGFSQGCFGLVSQGCFGLAFFPDHGGGPNRP